MERRLSFFLALCLLLTLPSCGQTKTAPNETPFSTTALGRIYLYGEAHADKVCMEKELELWGGYYQQGIRDLFVELPYYTAEYLNLWMKADTDDILKALYRDSEGSEAYSPDVLESYRRIKIDYPETVFHGTDVGHQYDTTGTRYLSFLEAAGQKDSETYRQTEKVVAQGKAFYSHGLDYAYRENCMVENFVEALESLHDRDIMGIYGYQHTNLDGTDPSGTVPCMAAQLAERYGDAVQSENLSISLTYCPETLTINDIQYEAVYYGRQDLSGLPGIYQYRDFWRLEDAYNDFRDYPAIGEVLPYGNYPMPIETEQVFVVDYGKDDGAIERRYYRSDGEIWEGLPITRAFILE